jgi:hypothetical protein
MWKKIFQPGSLPSAEPRSISRHLVPLASSWTTSYDSAVEMGPHLSPSSLLLRGVRLTAVSKVYEGAQCDNSETSIAQIFSQVKRYHQDYQGPDSLGEAYAQAVTTG